MLISPKTRREIAEAIEREKINCFGKLRASDFLSRHFPLREMPPLWLEQKYVGSNAYNDVYRHVDSFKDYSPYFFLEHNALGLPILDDTKYLDILCDMLHPEVRSEQSYENSNLGDEIYKILTLLNTYLLKDGVSIYPVQREYGLPSYSYSLGLLPSNTLKHAIFSEFPEDEIISNTIKNLVEIHSLPSTRLGSAKELLETISKHILENSDFDFESSDSNFNKVVKTAYEHVKMDAPNNTAVDKMLKSMASAINSTVGTLAELRNKYGTGHGKKPGFKELDKSYGELASNMSISIAYFLLVLLKKKEAQED